MGPWVMRSGCYDFLDFLRTAIPKLLGISIQLNIKITEGNASPKAFNSHFLFNCKLASVHLVYTKADHTSLVSSG